DYKIMKKILDLNKKTQKTSDPKRSLTQLLEIFQLTENLKQDMHISANPYSTFPNLANGMYNRQKYDDKHLMIIEKMKNQVKKSCDNLEVKLAQAELDNHKSFGKIFWHGLTKATVAALAFMYLTAGAVDTAQAADFYTHNGKTVQVVELGAGRYKIGTDIVQKINDNQAIVYDDCGENKVILKSQEPNNPIWNSNVSTTIQVEQKQPKEIVIDSKWYYQEAERKYKEKDYVNAIRLFKSATIMGEQEHIDNITLSMYHNRFADANLIKGLTEKALQEYLISVKLNPKDADAHYGIAQSARILKDYKTASKHIDISIELGFKHAPALKQNFVKLNQYIKD
ncbi:MAG: hypothetical protein RQ856_06475, partial [Candidatus Izemoplasmatales bacterium]|nr:hypothetical protein [Candidatus Izemoplasmatales bacterium]